jgi:hypothetical protein
VVIERTLKGPEGECNREGKHHVRQNEPCEKKQTDAGGHTQARVEARAIFECPKSVRGSQPGKSDDREKARQASCPIVNAKCFQRKRHDPVNEWRFFEKRDAVDVRTHPIA